MVMKLYCLYDRVVGSFGQILLFPNQSCAEREFFKLAKNQPYPDDIDLYFLGEYNLETGQIIGLAKADFICRYVDEVNSNG